MKSLLFAVLLTATLACHEGHTVTQPGAGPSAAGVPSNLVLRAYDVPGGAGTQVRSLLRELLWFGSDGKDANKYVGRAEVGVDGRLVVLAAPGVQDGVKALLESIAAHPPETPKQVQLTYWVVLGAPGKGATPGPQLAELAPALAEIEKSDGPQAFTLLEKLSGQGTSGDSVSNKGRDIEARHTAAAGPQGISADIHLERGGQRFDTRVKLQAGQVLVLGSSGAKMPDDKDAPRSLYYLIRAALHDGPER